MKAQTKVQPPAGAATQSRAVKKAARNAAKKIPAPVTPKTPSAVVKHEIKKTQTPRMLRRIQLAAAGVLIALGVATVGLGTAASSQLGAIAADGTQAVRLTDVTNQLLIANRAASEYLLEPTRGQPTEFAEALVAADTLIVDAVADAPAGSQWLGTINAKISNYGRELQRAISDKDAATLASATTNLDSILDEISMHAVTANTQATIPRSYQYILFAVAVIAAVVLLGCMFPTAQVSHRIINLGLVGALAASAVITGWTASTISTRSVTEYEQLYNMSQARVELTKAQLVDLEIVADGANQKKTDSQKWLDSWNAHYFVAADLLREVNVDTTSLTRYSVQHDRLEGFIKDNNWVGAINLVLEQSPESLRQTAEDFDAVISTFQKEELASTQAVYAQQSLSLGALSGSAILICLLGLIGAMWGMNRRLGEYK
ncbi:MAG: hypothetical protein FWG47_06410 [Propionibacteriaceae bacterium]|nr:hypothetical protein [Propionibacteriaceae bacterium]